MKKVFNKPDFLLMGFISLLAFAGFLSYKYYNLREYSLHLENELATTRSILAETSRELQNTILDRDDLAQKLAQEKSRMDELAFQVEGVISAVGLIEKIQATDEELLQKYSRVYFLNENYTPQSIAQISSEYIWNSEKEQQFHARAMPFLKNLLRDATSSGIDIKIISAYRSFGEQAGLKSSYTVIYGSGANKFSADQGYSEHQLGTTIDFTNSEIGSLIAGFDKTEAYAWLQNNAYKYGFVLSYPEGNTYYHFEPWHWRFVGRELAEKLHEEGKYFYDLDQRDINTYIASFFD